MSIRVQVVVAHPDDETFGCGSVLLHAASCGAVTAVCCATLGQAGEPPAGSRLTAQELGRLRERELHQAATLLGVSRVDLLGFADSGMSGAAAEGSLVAAPFPLVTAAVRERIEDFAPDILITLDASDGHRDHARIRDATIAACDAVGVPLVYLQCLPRSLMRRWADSMRRERPDVEHLALEIANLGTPDDEITTVVDTAGQLAMRERAIAAHASQVSPFEALPDDLRHAFLTADRLQRVRPPWPGGDVETEFLTLLL